MCRPLINWPPIMISLAAVKAILPSVRLDGRDGFNSMLSIGSNPKTVKSDKGGKYYTAILHLWPGATCPWATKGCLAGCLNTAGNPCHMPGKEKARKARTKLFHADPVRFMARLVREIEQFIKKCERMGRKPAIRLNGTSDIAWEALAPWLFRMFPQVRFYDYTKGYCRLGNTPRNYHLTLSRSESNDFEVGAALSRGFHVAVVIRGAKRNMPKDWRGWSTENGDKDDLLFLRKNPVQVLYPKGQARHDNSGWVVENPLQLVTL